MLTIEEETEKENNNKTYLYSTYIVTKMTNNPYIT